MRIIENPDRSYLDELQRMLSNEPGLGIVDIETMINPFYFVAEEDGTALGVATISQANLYPELYKLYVSPMHRQRGVGLRLVTHVISVLTASGAAELLIEIAGQSHGFWERVTQDRQIVQYDDQKFGIILP